MKLTITVNGETRDIASDASLSDLIKQLGLVPSAVAALINDEIIERSTFEEKRLADGDVVELVRFVPGG